MEINDMVKEQYCLMRKESLRGDGKVMFGLGYKDA